MKKCAWNFLVWSSLLFLVLTIGGLFSSEIRQSSEIMKWLVFRRWFPYPQAGTLAVLLTTSMIALSDLAKEFAKIENAPWLLKAFVKLGKTLNKICPKRKSKAAGGIPFTVFLALFILSMSVPRCVTPDQVRVSFDIRDDGRLIASVFTGETAPVESGIYIDIETRLETGLPNLPLSQITCAWTYMGDGSIRSATQCKTDYRTGTDDRLDTVSVKLSQPFCPSLGFHTFILKNKAGEQP
jgi:hypothetical protein